MNIFKRNSEWFVLKLAGKRNPVLIKKTSVHFIHPCTDNELQSDVVLWDKSSIKVDQPTGSIESQL